MKTTDTPESDAAWEYVWDEGGCNEGHLLDTMQKLERERNEARKAAEQWRSTAGDVAAMPITEHPFSWENVERIQPPTQNNEPTTTL